MHLPKPIYDLAPHYWVVVGILMMLLGLDTDHSFFFRSFSIALGALSTFWGASIFLKRRAQRQLKDSEGSA